MYLCVHVSEECMSLWVHMYNGSLVEIQGQPNEFILPFHQVLGLELISLSLHDRCFPLLSQLTTSNVHLLNSNEEDNESFYGL